MNMENNQDVEYGFGGRLNGSFPSQIIVDATEICNLGCTHCPHPVFKESPIYSGSKLDPALNRKMAEEVRDHGQGITEYIRYTSNGEPLVHPHIYDMMREAREISGVFVSLTTNGKIMREKQVEKIIDAGVNLVDISIDAFKDETYEKIRVGGKLPDTRKHVLNLIEQKNAAKTGMKVIVSFIEQPENTDEADDFEKFWKDSGADYVVIRRLHSAAGSIDSIKQDMISKQEKADIPRKPCLYPWERILLNATGQLAFCPTDWEHGSLIVDYNTNTISDVWQGEFYQKLREAHLTNNYENHSFCGQCPDWQHTRWPGEGRSYADMVEEFIREEATSAAE